MEEYWTDTSQNVESNATFWMLQFCYHPGKPLMPILSTLCFSPKKSAKTLELFTKVHGYFTKKTLAKIFQFYSAILWLDKKVVQTFKTFVLDRHVCKLPCGLEQAKT